MQPDLPQSIALLTQTPATLNALLRNLPQALTRSNEGEATWTIVDVLGHLNHCERVDWMPRVKLILETGATQPFAPLDREAFKQSNQQESLPQLLDEFASLRTQNLQQLRALNLTPQDLERRGQHPALGPVTLSQLLATWPTHDLTHLHQISRILAHQYRDLVGPWKQYLGVLQCTAHSA